MSEHAAEVARGERFEFGKNWQRFLQVLDEPRIQASMRSISAMLEGWPLEGRSFLDVGSGSGLSSLAAYRMGARVHAFDYDPQSVACTKELRRRYASPGAQWQVEEGSVLDPGYLSRLGQFDLVYSWGVLHHTGAMWKALENVAPLVAPGGRLFVAIYNDQGPQSRRWLRVKKIYNRLPKPLAFLFGVLVMGGLDLKLLIGDLIRLRPMQYVRRWTSYGGNNSRGMSRLHDHIDWLGGYPFEVAKPEEIFRFYRDRGFRLVNMRTRGGSLGCNEFVLERSA